MNEIDREEGRTSFRLLEKAYFVDIERQLIVGLM